MLKKDLCISKFYDDNDNMTCHVTINYKKRRKLKLADIIFSNTNTGAKQNIATLSQRKTQKRSGESESGVIKERRVNDLPVLLFYMRDVPCTEYVSKTSFYYHEYAVFFILHVNHT